ncbi:MAG TPA: TrmH family RNA methyltransferase [Acidocella sp.]|nr:TrmH family RNA methyltransferase [Acidocella sp.]HQU04316.1 TrmH family RNA methyltransferase [Acidocella sp.]
MSQNRPPNRPPHGKPGRSNDRPNDRANDRGGDKPRGPKPFGDKPFSDRPKFDGPKLTLAGKPGGKPQGERGGDRGERSHQDRPPRERNPHDRAPRHEKAGPRPPAVPNGAVWLYGTHAVAAALGNPARRLRRLVITEDAQASLAAERPQPWAIQPEITDRAKIDTLLGARPGSGIVHQGVALLTDQLTSPALLDALHRPGPILVLDQISDPRNIGALMRTAQAFGASMVIAQERNAPEETGALAKAASGALETIPLLRIVNISRALIVLKSANVWVVGLDGTATTRLSGPAYANRRVALVLGSEGEGMRRLTRETCDEIAALAMPGGMESLNVSAAGAVALYELTRGL